MSSLSKVGKNGECVSCQKSVGNSFVVCFFCHEYYHAFNCSAPTTICTPSFHQVYKPLSEKTGVNASRSGNFLFACDSCVTKYEEKQVQTNNNKIEQLQTQVAGLEKGMLDIKQLLLNRKAVPAILDVVPPSATSVWADTSACAPTNISMSDNDGKSSVSTTDNVQKTPENSPKVSTTSVLVIDKSDDDDNEKANMDKIEKVIDVENIDIQKSYKNKLGKTVIVCKSNEQRDNLRSKIATAIPTLPLKSVNSMNKTIVVAGFNDNYGENNVVDALVRHNDMISSFLALKSNAVDRSVIDNNITLVNVKPLKNNPLLFQAILKISSDMRSLISRNGDKLRVGMIRCPVYDRTFVKRCWGCQNFGHFHEQCPTKDTHHCAKCAGDHETKKCEVQSSSEHKCINCIRAGKSDVNHCATSWKCPIYENELKKIKQVAKN